MSGNNFIDYVKINCKSGSGGPGSSHLYRDKLTSMGGPDGGDGGRGGHIILRGNSQYWTLLHLKYRKHIKATHGSSGSGSTSTGAEGEDEYLDVPIGTIAKDFETDIQYGEILEEGQEIVLLQGGKGGLGNAHFKNSVRQTPRYAQKGISGIEAWIVLELKVLADVGLVGFPNAGKSTLLSVMSAAKPEIANYPFTTLVPNLGIVGHRDAKSFVMADIPGIIEGASEGKGLGLRFLRHIERNSILLFLVPSDSDDIAKEYKILVSELRKYNPELLNKNRLLAISKSDLLDEELKEEIKLDLPNEVDALFISSIDQQGLQTLKDRLWEEINYDPFKNQ
ncbi:MAG: GTPase ObgE [Flavobacteriales bacterium]|nr:GTPase ObgE [Flavobacteriales bacterium]|tara:strand:+ start:192 stop:1202 length:1011 start_codon:yes stop_codon:yes gene_type:complete